MISVIRKILPCRGGQHPEDRKQIENFFQHNQGFLADSSSSEGLNYKEEEGREKLVKKSSMFKVDLTIHHSETKDEHYFCENVPKL